MENNKVNKSKKRNPNHHRAGRWLKEPKFEHKIILEAIEIANRALERPVSVDEVAQTLLPKEKLYLEDKYSTSLNNSACKILNLLCRRGLVFSTGKIGKNCYYGLVGLLTLEDLSTDNLQSRRQRTFKLVRTAVVETGKALKMGEISEFAKTHDSFKDLNSDYIAQDVLSLKQTGEIQVVRIRGDSKGFGLYLPADFNLEDFLPIEPVSWLEFVLQVFNEIWNEHKSDSEANSKLPLPVATGEVRTKILASGKFKEKLDDPKVLIAAMQQLARTQNPKLKKIKRKGQKAILWIPSFIKQNEVNLGQAFAHNTERMEEAVKRASARLNRPVTVWEIREEIESDSSLEPVSDKRIHILVADLSRKFTHKYKNRSTIKIHQVGMLKGRAYFHPTNEPEASAFVEHKLLENAWELLNPIDEITNLERCVLPSVAFGRLRLLDQETAKISTKLKELKKLKIILGVSQSEREEFVGSVVELRRRINQLLRTLNGEFDFLPRIVNTTIVGLTVHEMTELIKPFYPRATNLHPGVSLQAYLGNSIRRIPNPNFTVTNAKNSQASVKYLYDKTDALIYIAKEWGGEESRLQANIAANELGLLRDPNFIVSGLSSKDFNEKITAISCLAFLSSENYLTDIAHFAQNDPDYGIRQSALWAYGLIGLGEERTMNFLIERSFQDSDSRVRKFVRNLIEKSKDGWLYI